MKRAVKFLCAGIICSVLFSLTSCYRYQEKWVNELAGEFPDDTFTYDGVEPGELGPHGDIARVSSADYPDYMIRIIKDDNGELITNYNYYRYKEQIDGYFRDYMEAFFDCDAMNVNYTSHAYRSEYTPIEDISFDRFMERNVTWNCIGIRLFYEDEYPDDEQMKDILLSILQENKDKPVNIFAYIFEEP